jgi:hypothetical protein
MRPQALPNSRILRNKPQHLDRSVIPTEAKWRDLLFQSATNRFPLEASPSPLSSRPERSAVEGSAVRPSVLPNSP